MDEFERELKMGFLEEATQLLADVEMCFLTLERNTGDQATLEKIFRLAHNLKGGSKAVGFEALGTFTHEFESFLLKCKNGTLPITGATVSLMLKCNDHICRSVEALKGDPGVALNHDALVEEILSFAGEAPAAAPGAEAPAAQADLPQPDDASREDAAPAALEIAPALTTPPPVAPPAPAAEPNGPASKAAPAAAADESIRVSLGRLEKLLNFIGELVIMQTVLREQCFGNDPQLLRRTVHQMGKVTKEVQDLSMSLRMVSLKQTFQKMQRIVRDTSGLLQKKVSLEIEGDETEVDKTVLETLGDPLVHLVRNAVDHGIELPADRLARGKPETGTIRLRAYHQGGRLVIEVQDDGGGIDAQRLRDKATEKGILKPGQAVSDQDAIHLIFHPGFSTKAEVTEVSGRGVGMDVVKTNIEKMQGQVLVTTQLGKGSVFKVVLPLTMAIIDGMVVRSFGERFVIPLSHVHESVRPGPGDIFDSSGLGEVLLLRGQNIPVVRLGRALLRKEQSKGPGEQIAVIIHANGQPFATLVDDIVGQHQVVIKKLGSEIQHLKGYSGTAILGDGKPALILELSELVNRQKSGRQVAS